MASYQLVSLTQCPGIIKSRSDEINYVFHILNDSMGCPRGVMVKTIGCGIVVSEFVTPVAPVRSLSEKYPWERYKPPYPSSYGLNSTLTVLLGE